MAGKKKVAAPMNEKIAEMLNLDAEALLRFITMKKRLLFLYHHFTNRILVNQCPFQ